MEIAERAVEKMNRIDADWLRGFDDAMWVTSPSTMRTLEWMKESCPGTRIFRLVMLRWPTGETSICAALTRSGRVRD